MSAPFGELQVDQLRYMANQHGPEIAYRDLDAGTSLTFAEWDEQSNRLARFLVHQGVEAGDRISIYLPSDEALRWIITYAATHKAGAIAVPTNTRLSIPELVTILGHAEVAACVTCESLAENALKVRDRLPCLRLVVTAGGATGTAFDYEEALHEDGSDIQVPTGIDDLADIMYTSGTTGLPKGVAVRHRNVAMLPNHEPQWTGSGWMHGAPLFTFAGIAFIYNPMKMGLHGMYLPKFDAHRWLDIVERERPPMAFLVPAMAELLVATPELAERDLTSLRMVSIGSAPLAPRTLLALQERLPDATVSNSYGMTEAGPAFIVMPKEEVTKRIGSVGKPVGPTELRVVREDESTCDPGEVGEVLTRMSGRQREYYKDEAATANTWTEDGWLRSGDLGYLDDDGFLYLVGRKKDLIIRGGNNIYPTDVEAVLLEHPAVQEAAVVGIPHAVLGEDVAAFVVARPDGTLENSELLAFCAERLADYKRPRQLHVVDELPRNATGKVMKHLLEVPAGSAVGSGTGDEAAR